MRAFRTISAGLGLLAALVPAALVPAALARADGVDEAVLRACGLSDAFQIADRFDPAVLIGDLDGDNAMEHIGLVRRIDDDAFGIAVCRGGGGFDVLGLDAPVAGSAMDQAHLRAVEAWGLSTMAEVPAGWDAEPPRPATSGDVLVLERIEKALYSIYWDGEAFRSHQHYRYVEP